MGKAIKKVHKAVQKVTKSDDLLGDAGLWNLSGKNTAREEAEREAKRVSDAQAAQQAALQQMQQNMQVDLRADNLSNVVAGGSADSFEGADPTRRRRRPGGLTAALQV